jgi:serine/threonine protein kinase
MFYLEELKKSTKSKKRRKRKKKKKQVKEETEEKQTDQNEDENQEKKLEEETPKESPQEEGDSLSIKWQNVKFDLALKCLQVKIVDLGNGIETEPAEIFEIQTMEYKCPETILGLPITVKADIWSLACVVFEILTGNYLFKPKKYDDRNISEEEDLLGIIISTLGPMDKNVLKAAKHAKKYFKKNGKLKVEELLIIERFPIFKVLMDEFEFNEECALDVDEFLVQMLQFDPKERVSAEGVLKLKWLNSEETQKEADQKQ